MVAFVELQTGESAKEVIRIMETGLSDKDFFVTNRYQVVRLSNVSVKVSMNGSKTLFYNEKFRSAKEAQKHKLQYALKNTYTPIPDIHIGMNENMEDSHYPLVKCSKSRAAKITIFAFNLIVIGQNFPFKLRNQRSY